jgi:DNA-3-methyladenine glycosylase
MLKLVNRLLKKLSSYNFKGKHFNLLPISFFEGNDVTEIAESLISCIIVSDIGGKRTAGIITETEAYCGFNDKASHAFQQKRTSRNEAMFLSGGYIYVYLCYGLHYMLNIVTNQEHFADAVLIRSIEPIEGIEVMLERRKKEKPQRNLSCGPGNVAQALGITLSLNKNRLQEKCIGIYRLGNFQTNYLLVGKRIGVEYAGDDSLKLWRFGLKNSAWLSKPF